MGVATYAIPTELKCNPMPMSTDWTRAEKGEVETGLLSFVLSSDYPDVKRGDLFYVDVAPNMSNYVMGDGADYILHGIEKTLNVRRYILKRMAV